MKFDKNAVFIAIIAMVLIIGVFIAYEFMKKDKESEYIIEKAEPTMQTEMLTEEISESALANTKTKKDIKVYISGEVVKPGVYKVNENDRINDVVGMAGGFTEKADAESINLAEYVKDEQHITVLNIDNSKNNLSNNSNKSINETDNKLININTATADELKAISGIGDVIANNIIEYRTENGDFKSIQDLKKVSKIGDKLFEKIKAKITIS